MRSLLFFLTCTLRIGAEFPVWNHWEDLMKQYGAQRMKNSMESASMAALSPSVALKSFILLSWWLENHNMWTVIAKLVATAQCPLVCIVPGLRITFHKIQSVSFQTPAWPHPCISLVFVFVFLFLRSSGTLLWLCVRALRGNCGNCDISFLWILLSLSRIAEFCRWWTWSFPW